MLFDRIPIGYLSDPIGSNYWIDRPGNVKKITVKKLPDGTPFTIGIGDDNGINISTLEQLYPNIQLLGFYDENHEICITEYSNRKLFPFNGEAWKADITYFPIFGDNVDSSSSSRAVNSDLPNFFSIDKVNISMVVAASFLTTLITTLVDLTKLYFDPFSTWLWIVYDLQQHLSCNHDDLFDIVYTSYGVICWSPDINQWASLISRYLKPNGVFVMVEFHPVLSMFNDTFSHIENSYFNRKAMISQDQGTYANRDAPISNESIVWNHSLSDVLQALLNHGLRIDALQEFDYSPHDCFINSVKTEDGFYQIKGLENKLPIIYAVKATKSV